MLITLIIPPSPFLLDERVFMSLGVLKVAASLEVAGHEVKVLDLSGVANYLDAVRAYMTTSDCQVYGVTATSPQMPAASHIGALLNDFGKRTILGGPHVTLVHAAARLETKQGRYDGRANKALKALVWDWDCLVVGDGERAIFQALACSDKRIINADDPANDLFLTNRAFEESPFPARHLIDVSSYNYSIDGTPALSLIGQLGCPFKCTFCAGRDSAMLRRMRLRSSDSVVAEIEHLHRTYGVRGFMFLDDELNVNKGMVELMRKLKAKGDELGVEWRLRGFLKAELFSDEQAEAMYAAGFRQLLIGFESAHPRILLNIQKNATVEDNTQAVEIAHRHGLKVKALMSIGHPGENPETIKATKDWLVAVRPDDFDVTVITPYPGSPYYDYAEPSDAHWVYTSKLGDRLYMADVDFTQDALYYKGAPGEYVSYVWTDELDRQQIVELRDWVEEKVRAGLGIPYYPAAQGLQFEASMGQTKLPRQILVP